MPNPIEITCYFFTGYSYSDEPASDSVISQNENLILKDYILEHDVSNLQEIKIKITENELKKIDYIKARDTVTNQRFYYFVTGYAYHNGIVALVRLVIDNFASVGLNNINFYGNIVRRSLSNSEKVNYPLLPEPWAPKRPLKTRRLIIDLNINKQIILPSHISTSFEEETTPIEKTEVITVPNDIVPLTTSTDSLSIGTSILMGYPTPASDTSHSITTPWGSLSYTTPFETYYNLSGTALTTFLQKAKKYNALDLIENPYYLPNPTSTQNITINEISNPNIKNIKASKFYTTITIRSLASGEVQTYSDTEIDMQYTQPLAIILVPDRTGGIYLLPSTLRDTNLSAYTYLTGVYSPFESVVYNAAGDTAAKFASDGTVNLTSSLNNLYQSYINKTNALQFEGMQIKYYKDLASVQSIVTTFIQNALPLVSETVATVAGHYQNSNTTTSVPQFYQNSTQIQQVPSVNQSINSTINTPVISSVTNSVTNQNSSTQNTSTYINPHTQSTPAYNYTTDSNGRTSHPAVSTTISGHYQNTNIKIGNTSGNSNSKTMTNSYSQTTSGSQLTFSHNITSTTTTLNPAYQQNSFQTTYIPGQTTTSITTQNSASINVVQGVNSARSGVGTVFETTFNTLKDILFKGYKNEMHTFMLGNINDYLSRWVSIQNDLHNGKVANLFKNITLLGGFSDKNKLAGKYEILITSLNLDDEKNFDLFLEHFGYSMDEFSNTLVKDVNDNYNYTMIGEDASLYNSIKANASGAILNQFRTGVRVWKKLIRPSNY